MTDKAVDMVTERERNYMRPYICPICNSTGIVSGGFYFSVNGYCSSTNATEMCRQCNGSGVIWGVEDYDHEGLVSNTFEEVLKDG